MRDVASAAGVSTAAISRWLNGSIVLPEATVARIRLAIDALGYQPNPHARRLSLGRSDTIALVVPDIANPFFARLASAVEEASDGHGLGVVLCATLNRPGRELDYLDRLQRNHVDGLLFVTNHADDGTLKARIDGQHGVVLLDEDVAGTHAPKIFCENEVGGYLAARCLIQAGHRAIAFAGGPPGLMSAVERSAGFRRALREAGMSPIPDLMRFGTYTIDYGRRVGAELLALRKPPTAVFASSDEIAIGILEALRSRAIRVPTEVSIVAFDDVNPLHLFGPGITAIRQPVDIMGRRGVERLVARLAGDSADEAIERLPVEIVERESVAPPAHDEFTRRRMKTGRVRG